MPSRVVAFRCPDEEADELEALVRFASRRAGGVKQDRSDVLREIMRLGLQKYRAVLEAPETENRPVES
jgi:hypothetical protein